MNKPNTNYDANVVKVRDLERQIKQLETALAEKQAELDLRDGEGQDKVKLSLSQQQKRKKQTELFNNYRLCEANWAHIPEGIFQGQKMPGFKLLNTPVTFEMFDIFCASSGQQPPGDEVWGRENRPVININHINAVDYARWLSEQTGWDCQLPTEQQWEYACRAGTISNYWYGDTPDPRMMVMGTGKTMPTPGIRMANSWGLYDMHGNVWEWTSSNKGGEIILCGGSWYNKANWLTCSARNISFPTASNNNWGFRLIRKD